jgi:hypothetical protein
VQKDGVGTFEDFKASVKTNFELWLKETSIDSMFKEYYTLRQFFEFELEVKAHLKWVGSRKTRLEYALIQFDDWLTSSPEDIQRFQQWREQLTTRANEVIDPNDLDTRGFNARSIRLSVSISSWTSRDQDFLNVQELEEFVREGKK